MKRVNRVIFALTPNPVYAGYWNVVSQVWRAKFGVTPTLMLNCADEELESFRSTLSQEHGEILHAPSVPSVVLNKNRDWSCTWSLFWGASLFPDDICMLSGIDQLPLGGMFFDHLRQVPRWDERYVVGFGDAYEHAYYPSSHHVAKGSLFKDIYDIKDSWEAEVVRVFNTASSYTGIDPKDKWGLDEEYSSSLLQARMRAQPGQVAVMDIFWKKWHPRRLERGSSIDFHTLASLAEGNLSEWHMPRPFETVNPAALSVVESTIPVYKWD